ncbi:nucleotidyltransferase domain-containing protein [Candidatus Parcubacteria bacterium]|nr:nucleotidyltransferase domain-containing protein [Candidatus Parcubacteria bacterium]
MTIEVQEDTLNSVVINTKKMINFKAKITQAVLGYFFINPRAEMYLNEMVRKFKVDRGNLVRKLAELEREGVLLKNKKGNLSLYTVNRRYPFLPELKKIFKKSFGLENELKESLKGIKGIRTAIIFGSYAKDKLSAESDIDLLLVGSHKSLDAQREIIKLQSRIDREINVVDMTEDEFRRKKNEEFLTNALSGKIIKLI